MGQREAAEKTRKKFDLATFSHTTLGRAMIRLETRIKTFEDTQGREGLSSNTEQPDAISTDTCKEATETDHGGYIPSVNYTRQRRETIITFLTKAAKKDTELTKSEGQCNQLTETEDQGKPLTETEEKDSQLQDVLKSTKNCERLPYKGAFFDMCHRIVGHIYKKYRCLLL